MKKKIFAVSDIHGEYEILIKGLKEAGFDEDNPEHNRKFEVKLNGHVVMYFNDPAVYEPAFKNTNYGYVVVITPYEDFSKSRLWVKFKDI